ncbi:2-haloacid dehalogenase [Hasllibacter halocynthiae]|uniref:2-haloacid dehalogenase n=1 Tax=Hasllibacter halocynthiae TaxID=595589 RepID=A0A2T0X329_9RHOB|nr:HAD family phosphatase [Hasllibacter halocynthiae]PRY93356.1 2-haloacid dehalogenase [Hasllibacter halocynthiae]
MTSTEEITRTVDAVVWDIGNVLIEWQPERHYDAVIGEERRRAMFDAIDLHGMNDRIDKGEPFRDTIYAVAAEHPEWERDIRRWHDEWIAMASPPITWSIELLRALRSKGIPCFALSNFGTGSFAYAETQYPFLTEFDLRFVSGQLGTIKPEARIYEIVEEESGVRPEHLLFTDDRAENVEAAAARGWQTHRFDGPAGWAERLVAEGLLTAAEAAER